MSEGPRRDLQVESLWEYGSRRGIWRILEILARHDVRATFFCSGRALERNPQAAAAIREGGHEICGHGYRYVPYHALSEEQERADMRAAMETIKRLTGAEPVGWYSRAPSVRTRSLLRQLESLRYDCDSNADDLPFYADPADRRLLTIPYPADASDERFWAMSGVSGFTNPEDLFEVLKASFERAYAEAEGATRMMSFAVRLRITGRPSRALQLDRFLAYSRGFPDVWFAPRAEIASWWMEHAP